MLDSVYHMTNTLKSHFWRKKRYNFVITSYVRNDIVDVITFPASGLSILFHGVISLPDATSYDKGLLQTTDQRKLRKTWSSKSPGHVSD